MYNVIDKIIVFYYLSGYRRQIYGQIDRHDDLGADARPN